MTCGQAVSSRVLVGGLCAALEAASPRHWDHQRDGGREGWGHGSSRGESCLGGKDTASPLLSCLEKCRGVFVAGEHFHILIFSKKTTKAQEHAINSKFYKKNPKHTQTCSTRYFGIFYRL